MNRNLRRKKNALMRNDSFDFSRSIDTIFKDLIKVVVHESIDY